MTQAGSTDIQLGDLLIHSGLIDPEQFDAAYRLSFKMRLPIGRVLTMHGHVTEDQLRNAIEIQARMRDGLIPFEHAVQALGLVGREGIALETAMQRMGTVSSPQALPTHNRLGELLMAAGLASRPHVEECMVASAETGLPLGMVLLNRGVMTRASLNSSLSAQRLIRDGKVDRDQVLYALKMARLRSVSLQQALKENSEIDVPLGPTFGFGELFIMAGVISESQLLTAKELELTEDKPMAQIFVELGYASLPCAQAANHILNMIEQGVLFEDQAAQIVKRIQYASSKQELQTVLAMLDNDPTSLQEEKIPVEITEILKKTGLLSDKDLQIATALALANKVPLLKTLFDANLIDEAVTHHATQLKMYLDHDLLTLEQATIIMTYCLENNMTVDETLETFGWTAPG
ncbi:MAG: hypothetical protein K8F91_03025 [Candidatus Obscuribacterales bacterium]|nr:hypothetical protein [Candidatus Obscuribacterales bacterium]